MDLLKKIPNKIKVLAISSIFILFSTTSFATSIEDIEAKYSTEYKKWLELSEEEKINTPLPNTYTAELPETLVKEFTKDDMPSILKEMRNRKENFSLDNLSASYTDSRYSLKDDIEIDIKNQGITNQCWAFSAISSLETNLSLTQKQEELVRFSARHMDYATSRTFADGVNEKGYIREVGDGGIPNVAFNYLVNGEGAVLEEDMPFENNEDKINLAEIEKETDTITTGYSTLPVINKTYDENGNAICTDSLGNIYTEESLEAARNIIKDHIVKYGGIATVTAAGYREYYNNPNNIAEATAYYCNKAGIVRDHAITIVGWDDNYSRTNFNKDNMPKEDGAYIILNSYGPEVFEEGYYYISYEDVLIETSLYGVTSAEKVDYENIYQNDFYGGLYPIGAASQDEGYIASVYERNVLEGETLNSVGITNTEYAQYEIYVNPNGRDLSEENLIKVGETDLLSPGYSRIDVNSTDINSKEFAIVLKQKSFEGEGFYFPIEINLENTVFANVNSKAGSSYISLDGNYWFELRDVTIQGVDMNRADTCIKAFTTINSEVPDDDVQDPDENPDIPDENPEQPEQPDPDEPDKPEDIELKIISDYYKIENGYITKVTFNTSIEDFKKKITTNATQIDFLDKDGNVISDTNELVKTGMKVRFNNKETYTIIVRGDIDMDGTITLTDLSKLVAHFNELRGFILSGDPERAGDLDGDGTITLTDVSKLVVIFSAL